MHIGTLKKRLIRGASALFLAAAAVSAPAAAGTLQVDPIRLDISQQRRTASVVVRNMEQVPVTIRAYPLAWAQESGEDVYTDTAAVIVSPPVFTIPGGGSQTVRVALRGAPAGPAAYRLMIEEVPEANPGVGIQVALRLNLPLYSSLPPGGMADIVWSARRAADGAWQVEAANRGSGWVRIEADQAAAATGIRYPDGTAFGTVLPGASRVWTIGPRPDIADAGRFRSLARENEDATAQAARRAD
ncbi:MAG: molecular chaperone [Allosphingosinicella sp.]|uniref:fimbrial biogenesis chaperone n=1 Tax=Allosphingosinicella sp. TaxID=2823234 RepID=UPI003942204B